MDLVSVCNKILCLINNYLIEKKVTNIINNQERKNNNEKGIKRILIVNSYYYPDMIGGAELIVKTLAENLSNLGMKVHIACIGVTSKDEEINSVIIHRFKWFKVFKGNKNHNISRLLNDAFEMYNPVNEKRLKKIIKKVHPDIIHVHSLCNVSPSIWHLAQQMKIPLIHTIHDSWLKDNTLYWKFNNYKIEFAHITGLLKRYHKKMSKNVDYITAPSEYMLNTYRDSDYFVNVNYKKIPNALECSLDIIKKNALYKKKQIKSNEKIKYLYIGRLDSDKGIDILLEAFCRIENSNIELHIAGRGKLEQKIYSLCKKDLRIKYYGFVQGEEKEEFFKNGNVLIFPTKLQESFGLVILEAYQRGIPVIACDIGAIPELVNHERTGLLIRPYNVNDIVKSIQYFSDKLNIYNKIDNCCNTAQSFLIDGFIDNYMKIYQTLCEK